MPVIPKPCFATCWDYNWSLQLSPKTLVLSNFIAVHQVEKAVRFGIRCQQDPSSFNISCYVTSMEHLGLTVNTVTCVETWSNRLLELKQVEDKTNKNVRLFTINHAIRGWKESTPTSSWNVSYTFHVYVTGTADQYIPGHFDPLHGLRLWSAAVRKQMTDVQIKVVDQIFFAHKFVISERSPVLRAMFTSNMMESRTGRVHIEDVDPEIFRQFLYFVYTGQLQQPTSPELGKVADKYQVESLAAICQPAASESDIDDMGMLLMLASSSDPFYESTYCSTASTGQR